MKYRNALLAVVLATPFLGAQTSESTKLVDLLPQDSLIYLEINDIPGLRDGLESGTLGRVFHDAQVQDFIGGLVGMGQQQWESVQAMGIEQGLPLQFLSWDAFKSLSFGAAIHAGDNHGIPSVFFGLEIQFADGFAPMAFEIIATAIEGKGGGQRTEVDGRPVFRMVTPMGAPEVEMSLNGSQLLVTANLNMEAVGSLSASPAFLRGQAQVLQPGMVFSGFYSPRAGLEMQSNFLRLGAEKGEGEIESFATAITTLAEQAVGNAEGISFAAGWDKGESVGIAYVDFDGKVPGWAYAKGTLDKELVKFIPDNANSFSLASFAGGSGFQHVMGSLDEIMEQEAMQQNLAVWAEAEPISYSWLRGDNRPLLDQAVQGLGSRIFSYSTPSAGMVSLLELKDPAAVQAAATPLVKALAKTLDSIPDIPVAIRAKRESRRSNPGETIPIYYLRIKMDSLPAEMQQMSMVLGTLEPSFAISPDGWIISSFKRANVRSLVRSGLQEMESNILENPEAKDFFDRIPSGGIAVKWSDPRPGIEQGMGTLQAYAGLGSMALQDVELPFEFDLTKIPGADAINAYLKPSETVAWMDEDGMKTITRGSIGFADGLALIGYAVPIGAGAASYFVSRQVANTFPEFDSAAVLVEPFERPTDPLHATQYELQRLQTGILLFEMMNDQALPTSLEELTGTGPEGQHYLDRPAEGLVADGWGNAFIYNPSDGAFTLYSVGPDGTDNGGQGDDISLD